ncbi:hypothetical protein EMEDMD4_980012 [Sinorhizobium medicae]|uniref:Uncharacterized protein n=1 Tax=Sinorhizobium medicae TaxID=110321 RepID=A0A508XCK3_9HYPH|nr:hypothetical protein EMEDMD4_980012 [Sinorhizobium medicae]
MIIVNLLLVIPREIRAYNSFGMGLKSYA